MQPLNTNDSMGSKILSSFSEPYGRWRTIGGLARDTGYSPSAIHGYILQHPHIFTEFPFRPAGHPVYGLKPGVLPFESVGDCS